MNINGGVHEASVDIVTPFSETYPDLDTPDLVLGSCFFAARCTRGPDRASAGGSTGVVTVRGTPAQLHYSEGGVQIPVQDQTADHERYGSGRERQVPITPATPTTALAGRLPPIRQDDPSPIPAGFVEQRPLELSEPDIPDRWREPMILEHPRHLQVLEHQDRRGVRQPGGHLVVTWWSPGGHLMQPDAAWCSLVQPGAPVLRALSVQLGERAHGLLAVLAARVPATPHPLQTLQLLQAALEMACSSSTCRLSYQCPACSLTVAKCPLHLV